MSKFTNYGNKYKFKALNGGKSRRTVKLQSKKKDGSWGSPIEYEAYGSEGPEEVRQRLESNNHREFRIVNDEDPISERTKKNISEIKDPKLRKTMESLFYHISQGHKPKGPGIPAEKTLSEKLEEERADIHKYHPNIKNTSKLDRDIKKAKQMEKTTKDCNEILRLSGFTVDGPDPAEAQRLVNLHNYQTLKNVVEENMKRYKPGHPEYERLKKLSAKYDTEIKKNSKDAASNMSEAQRRLLDDVEDIKIKYKKKGEKLSHGKLLQELGRYGWEDYELTRLKLPLSLDACPTKDSYVTWVKPSGVEYKIGDVIQFKGKEVKITKITGNVVEATVLGEAKDDCGEKIFTKGKENEMAKDADAKSLESRLDFLEKKIRELGKYGDKYTRQKVEGYKEEYDHLVKRLQSMNKDSCSTKDYDDDDDDDTMTTAEAKAYWNRYHNSDPVLKGYKSFEAWYRESKRNGYIKDNDATEGGAVREYGDKNSKTMEDAYNHSDWENEPRHRWTISMLENELSRAKNSIELNRKRIPTLRSMVQSGQYGSSTLRELKEEEADYQKNMMKIKTLLSMIQRAKGQKDACPVKDANYSGWSKRDISYDLRSKEDLLRSLEDDLRSGEYDGTVQGIKSPEALKSLIRKTKQEIEEAKRAMSNAKDADPKVAEAEAMIKLCGGVM